ncbi:MAG TPA: phospho-N-acetylmuramoyl-pentapeptide-transferase [Chitinivibrionales bacterium]|nr:phospho-N-acetylmuramoyl-pentapeptide-transferase [Chitinivibrionales bacterium]
MFLDLLYQHTHLYLLNSRLFSTSVATIFSFLCAMAFFPSYIAFLKRINVNTEFEAIKGKTDPVMPAGILFLFIITVTSVITARFNSYVISALGIYVFFSVIGAIDDIAKVVNKARVSKGLITKQDYQYKADGISANIRLILYILISCVVALLAYKYIPNINGYINIPFLSISKDFPYMPFWLFIPFMTLVIAVMANGVNFTDGFDTLAAVPLITCFLFVGVIAYVSSHAVWSRYLLIPFIGGVDEILPVIGSMVGTLLAFLWFNAPPSSIIMGDSGAVGLGGTIGIMFIFIKAAFFLPVVGFIFVLEFCSVVLQIVSFRTTGKRMFLRAPIHHHFQFQMRKNPFYANEFYIRTKITWRFHIISMILLVVGLIIFLKVR